MNGVIIIDDEIWVTEVIKKIVNWEEYGFQILQVYHDGIDAIEGINKLHPKLILTDIRMPGMTGLDIIRRVSNEYPDIMCVVISGYNDFEYAKTALTYGAIGYLLKPIDGSELEQIVNKANKLIENSESQKSAEMQIRKNYTQTIDKLREQFFSNYFEGLIEKNIEIKDINNDLKLNLKGENFRLISIVINKLSNLNKIYTEINKLIWEKQLPVLCSEIIPLIYDQKIIVIFNYKQEDDERLMESVRSLFSNIIDKRELGEITFTISDEFQKIDKLRNQYSAVKETEAARLFLGTNKIYFCNMFSISVKDSNVLLQPNLDICLRQAIKDGSLEDAAQIVRDAFEWMLARSRQNPIAFSRGVFRIIEILEENIYDITDISKIDIIGNRKKVEVATSIDEIKKILHEIVQNIISEKNNYENYREKSVVDQIAQYIQQNYMHDITLTDMAELVHLNANYVCEVFSKEIKKTFKEYLTNIRIEAAKELLKKSNYKQVEIANLVGYNDTKHFSKVFKKSVGISTLEYRKLMVGK